mgnify:CR=1 FL=1
MSTFSGNKTIKTVLQLIRYDIPALILGKSSVGKSYTLIDISEKWHISNAILYIGSEKSENIEGIPKLTDRKEGKEILEYLQPYWFPNGDVITKSVKNGYKIYKDFIKNYWSYGKYTPSYKNLHHLLDALSYVSFGMDDMASDGTYSKAFLLLDQTNKDSLIKLNDKPFLLSSEPSQKVVKNDIKKDSELPDEYTRNDLKDFCSFLTTALGYGNYWLILDEIDKVDKFDKDKFAPLLHIVRERTLKNFTMIEVNNGKGLGIPKNVSSGNTGYAKVIEIIAKDLAANESVLDTRVIAIANETKEIEKNADALFRRFVQVIVEEVMIWRPTDIPQNTDKIQECVAEVKKTQMNNPSSKGADGISKFSDQISEAKIARIAEINLQWLYNFLPKIVNQQEPLNNYFHQDLMGMYSLWSSQSEQAWLNEQEFTALYKLLADNYKIEDGVNTPQLLFNCLASIYIGADESLGENVLSKEEMLEGKGKIIQDNLMALSPREVVTDIVDKLAVLWLEVLTEDDDSTKELKFTNWTKELIAWIEASVYDKDGEFNPIGEVYKILVPTLVKSFYQSASDDEDMQMDIFAANAQVLQMSLKKMFDNSKDIKFDMRAIGSMSDIQTKIGKSAQIQSEIISNQILYENFVTFKQESIGMKIKEGEYGIKDWILNNHREWLEDNIKMFNSSMPTLKDSNKVAQMLKYIYLQK